MTQQEMIDQLVRTQIGDLVVQIAVLKARIVELETTRQQMPEMPPEMIKPNGRQEKRVQDG